MWRTISRIVALLRDDRGQDIVEYALIAALISVAVVGALTEAGSELGMLWDGLSARITDAFD